MKLFKTIYYIFVAFLAMIALLLIVSVFPIEGAPRVKTVLSGSMEPAISVGSVIVARPADEYRIGDVIAFQFAGEAIPTTHRIYDIQVIEGVPNFITKGDANEEPDAREVRENEVLGRVLFSVPYIGYAVNFAQQPLGFVLVIVVPATIIIYDEFRKIGKEIVKLKNKKKDKEQDKKIQQGKGKDQEQDKKIEESLEMDKKQDREIKELKQEIEELKDNIQR